jgi:hypothetical protein
VLPAPTLATFELIAVVFSLTNPSRVIILLEFTETTDNTVFTPSDKSIVSDGYVPVMLMFAVPVKFDIC